METMKGKVKWIDIVRPSEEDLAFLKKEFKVHPVILEEIKGFSARTHVETYDDYLFMVFQFPTYDSFEKVSRRSEIDFLITHHSVVTVHYEDIEPLQTFATWLHNSEVQSKVLSNTLQFTCALLSSMLQFQLRQLSHVQRKVEEVSSDLFKDRERELLKKISYLKRDVSEYRIIVRPQEHILRSLSENGVAFWGTAAKVYLSDVLGEYFKVYNALEDSRQAVIDFGDTNAQLMNLKTTQIMKTFTALSFLTFPFVLFAAIFSMNTIHTPLVESEYGFWIIVGIIAAGIVTLFSYFKGKGWI